MLASAVRLLDRHRAELAGDVLFLFQPGEEGFAGARVMLGEALFDPAAVKRKPRSSTARASQPRRVAAGALLAGRVFEVALTGRGGHASMPHDAIDPIPVACEMVAAFQSFVTRRIDAFDPIVLSVTKIAAGTTNNVIPESASLLGTIRATSARARERAHEGVRRVAAGVAAAHDVSAKVTITEGYPVTVNDADAAALAREVTGDVLGAQAWIPMPAPVMGAEDFSFVLEKIPGAMVFLGVRPDGAGPVAPSLQPHDAERGRHGGGHRAARRLRCACSARSRRGDGARSSHDVPSAIRGERRTTPSARSREGRKRAAQAARALTRLVEKASVVVLRPARPRARPLPLAQSSAGSSLPRPPRSRPARKPAAFAEWLRGLGKPSA
jgi:hypothetical protein